MCFLFKPWNLPTFTQCNVPTKMINRSKLLLFVVNTLKLCLNASFTLYFLAFRSTKHFTNTPPTLYCLNMPLAMVSMTKITH